MGEPDRCCLGISLSVLVGDGTNAVDMLIDERQRNARWLGGMLDQSAKALGDRRDQREPEGRGLPFDVVSSTKQFFTILAGQSRVLCLIARRIEATTFYLHPLTKFAR